MRGYSNERKYSFILSKEIGERNWGKENVLMNFPAFNKTGTRQFSHRGGREFAEDGEHDYFVEFDTQVTQISHRAVDADCVRLLGRVI